MTPSFPLYLLIASIIILSALSTSAIICILRLNNLNSLIEKNKLNKDDLSLINSAQSLLSLSLIALLFITKKWTIIVIVILIIIAALSRQIQFKNLNKFIILYAKFIDITLIISQLWILLTILGYILYAIIKFFNLL